MSNGDKKYKGIKVLDIINDILNFTSKEQKKRKKKEKGLKILKPKKMLSRLPITLAQLKAGYNSEKVKNKVRQSLYSWYRSKNLTKQLYKSLIDII